MDNHNGSLEKEEEENLSPSCCSTVFNSTQGDRVDISSWETPPAPGSSSRRKQARTRWAPTSLRAIIDPSVLKWTPSLETPDEGLPAVDEAPQSVYPRKYRKAEKPKDCRRILFSNISDVSLNNRACASGHQKSIMTNGCLGACNQMTHPSPKSAAILTDGNLPIDSENDVNVTLFNPGIVPDTMMANPVESCCGDSAVYKHHEPAASLCLAASAGATACFEGCPESCSLVQPASSIHSENVIQNNPEWVLTPPNLPDCICYTAPVCENATSLSPVCVRFSSPIAVSCPSPSAVWSGKKRTKRTSNNKAGALFVDNQVGTETEPFNLDPPTGTLQENQLMTSCEIGRSVTCALERQASKSSKKPSPVSSRVDHLNVLRQDTQLIRSFTPLMIAHTLPSHLEEVGHQMKCSRASNVMCEQEDGFVAYTQVDTGDSSNNLKFSTSSGRPPTGRHAFFTASGKVVSVSEDALDKIRSSARLLEPNRERRSHFKSRSVPSAPSPSLETCSSHKVTTPVETCSAFGPRNFSEDNSGRKTIDPVEVLSQVVVRQPRDNTLSQRRQPGSKLGSSGSIQNHTELSTDARDIATQHPSTGSKIQCMDSLGAVDTHAMPGGHIISGSQRDSAWQRSSCFVVPRKQQGTTDFQVDSGGLEDSLSPPAVRHHTSKDGPALSSCMGCSPRSAKAVVAISQAFSEVQECDSSFQHKLVSLISPFQESLEDLSQPVVPKKARCTLDHIDIFSTASGRKVAVSKHALDSVKSRQTVYAPIPSLLSQTSSSVAGEAGGSHLGMVSVSPPQQVLYKTHPWKCTVSPSRIDEVPVFSTAHGRTVGVSRQAIESVRCSVFCEPFKMNLSKNRTPQADPDAVVISSRDNHKETYFPSGSFSQSTARTSNLCHAVVSNEGVQLCDVSGPPHSTLMVVTQNVGASRSCTSSCRTGTSTSTSRAHSPQGTELDMSNKTNDSVEVRFHPQKSVYEQRQTHMIECIHESKSSCIKQCPYFLESDCFQTQAFERSITKEIPFASCHENYAKLTQLEGDYAQVDQDPEPAANPLMTCATFHSSSCPTKSLAELPIPEIFPEHPSDAARNGESHQFPNPIFCPGQESGCDILEQPGSGQVTRTEPHDCRSCPNQLSCTYSFHRNLENDTVCHTLDSNDTGSLATHLPSLVIEVASVSRDPAWEATQNPQPNGAPRPDFDLTKQGTSLMTGIGVSVLTSQQAPRLFFDQSDRTRERNDQSGLPCAYIGPKLTCTPAFSVPGASDEDGAPTKIVGARQSSVIKSPRTLNKEVQDTDCVLLPSSYGVSLALGLSSDSGSSSCTDSIATVKAQNIPNQDSRQGLMSPFLEVAFPCDGAPITVQTGFASAAGKPRFASSFSLLNARRMIAQVDESIPAHEAATPSKLEYSLSAGACSGGTIETGFKSASRKSLYTSSKSISRARLLISEVSDISTDQDSAPQPSVGQGLVDRSSFVTAWIPNGFKLAPGKSVSTSSHASSKAEHLFYSTEPADDPGLLSILAGCPPGLDKDDSCPKVQVSTEFKSGTGRQMCTNVISEKRARLLVDQVLTEFGSTLGDECGKSHGDRNSTILEKMGDNLDVATSRSKRMSDGLHCNNMGSVALSCITPQCASNMDVEEADCVLSPLDISFTENCSETSSADLHNWPAPEEGTNTPISRAFKDSRLNRTGVARQIVSSISGADLSTMTTPLRPRPNTSAKQKLLYRRSGIFTSPAGEMDRIQLNSRVLFPRLSLPNSRSDSNLYTSVTPPPKLNPRTTPNSQFQTPFKAKAASAPEASRPRTLTRMITPLSVKAALTAASPNKVTIPATQRSLKSIPGLKMSTRERFRGYLCPLRQAVCLMHPFKNDSAEVLSPEILSVTDRQSGAQFRFNVSSSLGDASAHSKEIYIADGALLTWSDSLTVGLEEISRAFMTIPGVNASLVPNGWVENHYGLIVWKLASYEKSFPDLFCHRALTPENTLLQLKYRYDIEIDAARRPALRKISEKDAAPNQSMVLFVSKIFSGALHKARSDKTTNSEKETAEALELSDGWYCMRAVVDVHLLTFIAKGTIRLGTKLMISGASLLGLETAGSPLEVYNQVTLAIGANSTRRARWDTALGFRQDPCPFPVRIPTILPYGGQVGRTTLIVLRAYGNQWMEKTASSSYVFRTEAEEISVSQQYLQLQQDDLERRLDVIRAEYEKSSDIKPTTKRPGCTKIKLTDGSQDLLCSQASQWRENLEASGDLQDFQDRIDRAVAEVREKFPKRNVVNLLRLRVCDAATNNTGKYQDVILTCWGADECLTSLLSEGRTLRVQALNISANRNWLSSSPFQMSSTKGTVYGDLGVRPSPLFSPRKLSRFQEIRCQNSSVPYGEIDVIGIHILSNDHLGQTTVYLADENMSFLSIISGAGRTRTLDMPAGAVVAFINLRWTRPMQPSVFIPGATFTEVSQMLLVPRQAHLIDAYRSLSSTAKDHTFLTKTRTRLERCLSSRGGLGSTSTTPASPAASPNSPSPGAALFPSPSPGAPVRPPSPLDVQQARNQQKLRTLSKYC